MSTVNHVAPNTLQNVPGATHAWNHRNQVMFTALGLRGELIKNLLKQQVLGAKVKCYIDAEKVQALGGRGAMFLEALNMRVEIISGKRTYTHFILANDPNTGYHMGARYRIGPMEDEEDLKETCGHLVMGRERDSMVTNPQVAAIYLRDNGVPPQFATRPSPPPAAAARRTYPVFPYVNKKGKLITKTGKPRNGWIIYRAGRHDAVKHTYPHLTTAELSSIIQDEWNNMDFAIKGLYADLANSEKLSHFAAYPGYEVKPRKSSEIQRRRTAVKPAAVRATADADVDIMSDEELESID
ncbi:MAT1-1-3 [Acephala macrosclerotiorum]|nr:MAT1-1-3 [Acephala macrosclerotiorum]